MFIHSSKEATPGMVSLLRSLWLCYGDLLSFSRFIFFFRSQNMLYRNMTRTTPTIFQSLAISNIILLSRARVGGWWKLCQHYLKLVKPLSCVWFFAIPWTIAYRAPLCIEFSRQEYWTGLPFPSPRHQPRDRTWVSHTAGRHFTIWAIREALFWS